MGDKHEHRPLSSFIKLKNESGTEDIHYSWCYENLPDEFRAVALNELNETEENKKKGILKLRDCLKRRGITDVDDYMLTAVLRSCKYILKNSEKKYLKYVMLRNVVIEMLRDKDMKRLESVLDNNCVGVLPYRDKHGRVILFTNPCGFDLEKFDLNDCTACTLSLILLIMGFPLTSVAGMIYFGECKSKSISIFYPIAKAFRQHVLTVMNLPMRFARVEFLHENFIVRWSESILRPFVPTKIRERVHLYGNDIQDLQKYYHPDMLPEEFGGTMGPMNPKAYKEELLKFMKQLKSDNVEGNNNL